MIYAVLDIESAGGKYNQEAIIEIAIYRYEGQEIVDRFSSFVNPQRSVDFYVTKITGITDKMLAKAPKFYQVAKRILEITEEAVLVAHNASFDYRLLRLEFGRLGYDYDRNFLCTEQLSRKLMPGRQYYKLSHLAKDLGILLIKAHRANEDAKATLELFKILQAKDTEKEIVKSAISHPMAPGKTLTERQIRWIETLPAQKGIYYMYDERNRLFFLSKASNIKNKVTQQFLSNNGISDTINEKLSYIAFEAIALTLILDIKFNEELSASSLIGSVLFKDFNKPEGAGPPFLFADDVALIIPEPYSSHKYVILIRAGLVEGYGQFDLNLHISAEVLKHRLTPVKSLKTTAIVYKYLRKHPHYKFVKI